MKTRILAATLAAALACIPVVFPEGWGPLAAVVPAVFLFAFAVFGAD